MKHIFARIQILVVSAGLVVLTASAQVPNTLIHSIPAPPTGVQSGAQLGYSVAVDGNYTVVGAPQDDFGGINAGMVKVFHSSTGALLFVLPNPSPAANDQFGIAVAISGTRVVVGAPFDDVGGTNTGSAYVYDLSTATPTALVATLNHPNPGSNDRFGYSVAISGTRAVVGAYQDHTGSPEAGIAFVYDLGTGSLTPPVTTLNNPSPVGTAAGDYFGYSVGISGMRVVVGAYREDPGVTNAGSAFVYDLSSGTPTVPVTLNNPDPALNDNFGCAVAISGTRVVVGAWLDDTGATDTGSAYVYDLSNATPTTPVATLNNPNPAAGDNLGQSVAIAGVRVVVGAHQSDFGASNAGSAYMYDLNSATPTVPVNALHNPTAALNDYFGRSVAISSMPVVVGAYYGTPVVVGANLDDTAAPDAGSAYAYDLGNATPTVPVATLTNAGPIQAEGERFGYSVATSGTLVVVGVPFDDTGTTDAGRAHVYDLSSGTPTVPVLTLNNPSPGTNDCFGFSVSISGTRLVVGARYDDTGAQDTGSAYVYDLTSPTPSAPVTTLINPGSAANDYFGWSVGISGTRVVVGANYDDVAGVNDAGSAYVYDISSITPTVPVAILNNPGPGLSDHFGISVAISGTRVVVGADSDDTGASGAGSAYVYDVSSATSTTPVNTLNNPGPAAIDYFGNSVAISGTRVVVGAYRDDSGATDAGSAYVYDLSSGTPTVPWVTLNNPGPAANDDFGVSVSISSTRVVVGAYSDDTGASGAGSAYVYDLNIGTPAVPVATLNNPAPAASDGFGLAVAISSTTIAIGTPFDDAVLTNQGITYIFGPDNPTTNAATAVTSGGATLNGTINPNGVPTTVQFQYGLTTNYGNTAAVILSPDNGTIAQAVSAALTGLIPGTTYHFRVTATNSDGTAYGLDMAFTTKSADIAVEQPLGSNVNDGGSALSFGGLLIGTSGTSRVFTIKNLGTADLTGVAITQDGTHSADYSVNISGMASTVIPGGSTTFAVTFSPGGTASGTRTAALHIASNDLDENPFDLVLTGQGFSVTQDTDGDGLNDWSEFQFTALGFDWQVSQTPLVDTLNSGVNSAGLYTPAQVQALNVGVPLLQRNPSTGVFTLTIGVEKSTDFSIFNPFPMTGPQTLINGTGKLEFQFTVPDNAAFFQLRAQ